MCEHAAEHNWMLIALIMQSTWAVTFTFIMLRHSIIQTVPADLYTRSEFAWVCLSVRSVFGAFFKGVSGFAWKETKPCACSRNSKFRVMFYSQKPNGMNEGERDGTHSGMGRDLYIRGSSGFLQRETCLFCFGFFLFLSVTSYQHTDQKLKRHIACFVFSVFWNTVESTCDMSSDGKINRLNLGVSSCDLFS